MARWWARPPPDRVLVGLVAGALGALVLAFYAANRPADSVAGSDVTVYQSYGSQMLDGAMPYRDFRMEYPPGAAFMFVLPATRVVAGGSTDEASWMPVNAAGRRYYRGFELLVLLLLGAIGVLTALTLRAMGRPAWMVLLALAVVASSPLLVGQVLTERFDVWPAALAAAALAAAVSGRYRLGGAMLGLGTAAKFYPVLLLPVLVIVAVRRRGVREAIYVAGAAVVAAAAVFLPFAVASVSGTWESMRIQFRGGLQIESLASSVLVLIRDSANDLTTRGAGGGLIRIDLAGPGVTAARVATTVLLVAALVWIWISLLRSRRDPGEDLLRYSAATVASVLAFGTVLSPQYIVWLIPLALLIGGERGTAAIVLFIAAATLTNVWIPEHYLEYQGRLTAGSATLLLVRNLALLALALVLLLPGWLVAEQSLKVRRRSHDAGRF